MTIQPRAPHDPDNCEDSCCRVCFACGRPADDDERFEVNLYCAECELAGMRFRGEPEAWASLGADDDVS